MALHNKILFGVFSKLVMTVAPVVVIPEILSNMASLKENSFGDKIKGRDPKTPTNIQAKDEKRNKKLPEFCGSRIKAQKLFNRELEGISQEASSHLQQ